MKQTPHIKVLVDGKLSNELGYDELKATFCKHNRHTKLKLLVDGLDTV